MRIAVSLASMSARFCSTGPPFMPAPTMLMNDRTRVRARSMTCSLNWRKLRHPAPPASTSVVWPLRKEWVSGWTAVSALLRYASFSVPKNTWAWMSMRPGTTWRPVASTTRRAWAGSMLAPTRAILVPATATSMTASTPFAGSMTRPFLINRSNWAVCCQPCSSRPRVRRQHAGHAQHDERAAASE